MHFFLYYTFIKFIILLYTLLQIWFARYKEYMICLISLSKFSDVLPAFTSARAIGNLRGISLVVKILRTSAYFVLYLTSDTILK